MIKLTTSTGINQKTKKEFDNSLYLVRIDSNNLALKRGDKTLNYFGDVRTALTESLNYAIKGSDVALLLELMLDSIYSFDKSIKTLKMDAVDKEAENEIS